MQTEVKNGVKAALPDIVSGIKEALADARVKDQVSWAEVASQKKLITEVVEQTSKNALEKSIQLIDSNLTDQKKRVRNVVMSGVKENIREGEASLIEVVSDLLECDINDMVNVKRLGEKKVGKSRFILIVFKSEEAALYYHNYGRGRKVEGNIWVNPDLTRTERDAMFKKRDERRKRLTNQQRNRPSVRAGVPPRRDNDTEQEPSSPEQEPSSPNQSRRGSLDNISSPAREASSGPANGDHSDSQSNHE